MIRNRTPRSWTAGVLGDLRTRFRRRRSPARGHAPADGRWGINLAALGGLIGLGRPDRIPRVGPSMQPRRSYEETDDWQPAPSYAQHPGQHAPSQPDADADWQGAQFAQHAEPQTPQRARRGGEATRPARSYQASREQQQPDEERNYLARMRSKKPSATARW